MTTVPDSVSAPPVLRGPNALAVRRLLAQLEGLTPDQVSALGEVAEVTEAYTYPAWYAAWDADRATGAASGRVVHGAAYIGLLLDAGQAARKAAVRAILAEVVRGLVGSQEYQVLSGPLALALDLPQWWPEPGSRNLFFEMLTEGATVADARASVSALV